MKEAIVFDKRTYRNAGGFSGLLSLYGAINEKFLSWTKDGRQVIFPKEVSLDSLRALRLTVEMINRWADENQFSYNGINLYETAKYKLSGYNGTLNYLIKEITRAETILDEYRPDRVRMIGSLSPFGGFLEDAARERGVCLREYCGWLFRLLRKVAWELQFRVGYYSEETRVLDAPVTQPHRVSGKKVFAMAVISNISYLRPILPLLQTLRKRGKEVIIVAPRLDPFSRENRIDANGIEVVFIEDFFTKEYKEKYHSVKKHFSRVFEEEKESLRETFAYDGIDLWAFLKRGVREVYTCVIPQAALFTDIATGICDAYEPEIVLTARLRRTMERAFFSVCRQRSMPRVLMPHGFMTTDALDEGYDLADVVCTWGEEQKEVIETLCSIQGVSPKVVVTGNPEWENLGSKSAFSKSEARLLMADELKIPEGKHWITLMTAITEEMYPEILDAVSKVEDCHLIVKNHPYSISDANNYYRKTTPENMEHIVTHVTSVSDLHTLLRASDVVITFGSTTELETILVGTPLVITWFPSIKGRERKSSLCAERYGLLVARSPEELACMIKDIVRGGEAAARSREAASRVLEDYGSCLDGKAVDRVIEAIDGVAGEVAFC